VRFFFSGELDSQIADAYRSTRKQVETTLNDALSSAGYGTAIEEIGIIPIILSAKFAAGRKERRLVKRTEKVADYRLFIDFDSFANGSEEERKLGYSAELVGKYCLKTGTGQSIQGVKQHG